MSQWGYTKDNGPSTWANIPSVTNGIRQSPIDIISSKCCFDPSLKNLQFSYPSFEKAKLQNNGHTIVFSPDSSGNTSEVSSGPVDNKYKLAQFHFHWGKENGVGSEHTVDGLSYDAELHLVHYNTDLYKSAGEALTAKNGLIVLGIFLKVGDKIHPGLKSISDKFDAVHNCDSSTTLPEPFNPLSLFPESLDYWSYPGSLTTPPCSESVTWVVFKEPISVSNCQLEAFRRVQSSDGGCLFDNFRPPQPINQREVRASFK